MEPTKKRDPIGTEKANKPAESDPTTKDPERNPEALEAKEAIVQDLLGDISEQTGASFG